MFTLEMTALFGAAGRDFSTYSELFCYDQGSSSSLEYFHVDLHLCQTITALLQTRGLRAGIRVLVEVPNSAV
jgi:hypothetical protein